jgi:hypothetical protein
MEHGSNLGEAQRQRATVTSRGAPAIAATPVLSASHPDTLRTIVAVDNNDSFCTGQCSLMYDSESTRACACTFGCNVVRADTRSDLLHRGTHNSACGTQFCQRVPLFGSCVPRTAHCPRLAHAMAGQSFGTCSTGCNNEYIGGDSTCCLLEQCEDQCDLGCYCRTRVGEKLWRL